MSGRMGLVLMAVMAMTMRLFGPPLGWDFGLQADSANHIEGHLTADCREKDKEHDECFRNWICATIVRGCSPYLDSVIL